MTSTPSRSIAASQPTETKASNDGPGAGPIVGIVAGSLLGVVLLSGIVGFLFKKYNKRQADPFEANPFSRRHSTMLPDTFDSDDGHGGVPEMSEHHNFGPSYESGVAVGAGAAAMLAHNEGGPRPPTMFARHVNGPAAQFDQYDQQAGFNAPQIGAYYKPDANGEYTMSQASSQNAEFNAPPMAAFGNRHLDEPMTAQRSISPAPQLPPLAAFGGDPYSIAGVGARMNNNIANPYAHLDRGHAPQSPATVSRNGSASTQGSFQQQAAFPQPPMQRDSASTGSHSGSGRFDHQRESAAADALVAGLAHQSQLQQRSQSPFENPHSQTAGRPGTSEGRSGTPDLPNVQQTYAIGNASDEGHMVTSDRASVSSQDLLRSTAMSPPAAGSSADPFASPRDELAAPAPLSVRNLMPPGGAGTQAQQRPVSTASSFADPEDAYGGVY